jgi:hypothetical protein
MPTGIYPEGEGLVADGEEAGGEGDGEKEE